MKTNKAIKDIQGINPAIFRGLHIKAGFDFEAPITVKRLPAPFTIKSAWKTLDAFEPDPITPRTHKAVIIMIDPSNRYWSTTPHAAPITADNLPDDFDKMSYDQYDREHHYNSIFTNFCRKSDFNDLRKKSTCEAWIIAQRNDLLKPWTEPARDWTERQHDMCEGEHILRTYGYYYYNRRPTAIIDKSNYRVDLIRADRARRAERLRAERAKAAADAATTETAAARYNELTKALHSARQRITDALNALDLDNVTSTTVESLRAIAKAIGEYSYSKGLSAAADRMQDFKRNAEGKRYSSPDRYNEAYKSIIENLAAIMPEEV